MNYNNIRILYRNSINRRSLSCNYYISDNSYDDNYIKTYIENLYGISHNFAIKKHLDDWGVIIEYAECNNIEYDFIILNVECENLHNQYIKYIEIFKIINILNNQQEHI